MTVVEQVALEVAAAANPFDEFLVDLADHLRENYPEQPFKGTRRALIVEVLLHKRCYSDSLVDRLQKGLSVALTFKASRYGLTVHQLKPHERVDLAGEPMIMVQAV